jgi:hypothetical protein
VWHTRCVQCVQCVHRNASLFWCFSWPLRSNFTSTASRNTIHNDFRSPSLSYLLVHSRCRGFLWFHLITLRHTPQSAGLLWTRDRPFSEISTWQHKHCIRQTSMPPVEFEPTIPASARPQTYALDRAATRTGHDALGSVNRFWNLRVMNSAASFRWFGFAVTVKCGLW